MSTLLGRILKLNRSLSHKSVKNNYVLQSTNYSTRELLKEAYCRTKLKCRCKYNCKKINLFNRKNVFNIVYFLAKKLPQDVNPQGVFACNELDLSEVSVYGFDYDYTLAHYKPSLEHLLYNLGRDMLLEKYKVNVNLILYCLNFFYFTFLIYILFLLITCLISKITKV